MFDPYYYYYRFQVILTTRDDWNKQIKLMTWSKKAKRNCKVREMIDNYKKKTMKSNESYANQLQRFVDRMGKLNLN